MYSLPNLLTISRILVIPVIFLSIYIHTAVWSMLAAVLFIVASITDYFDGYLARSRNETSAFGRLLDPIADKLLVASALIVILADNMVHPVNFIPVIIILCREILVSGLREFLSEVRVGLPVTRLAKWKTGFQMTALSVLLMSPAKFFNVIEGFWVGLGTVCLWVAGVLTFITGYQYFEKSLAYIKSVEKKKARETAAAKKSEAKTEPQPAVKKAAPAKAKSKTAAKSKKTAAKKTASAKKAPRKVAAAK